MTRLFFGLHGFGTHSTLKVAFEVREGWSAPKVLRVGAGVQAFAVSHVQTTPESLDEERGSCRKRMQERSHDRLDL